MIAMPDGSTSGVGGAAALQQPERKAKRCECRLIFGMFYRAAVADSANIRLIQNLWNGNCHRYSTNRAG
eukprot:SAG31_NODE_450_length_15512_cov_5.788555_20_plen_69_part_00